MIMWSGAGGTWIPVDLKRGWSAGCPRVQTPEGKVETVPVPWAGKGTRCFHSSRVIVTPRVGTTSPASSSRAGAMATNSAGAKHASRSAANPSAMGAFIGPGVRDRTGQPLLHAAAYYTLNQIPKP